MEIIKVRCIGQHHNLEKRIMEVRIGDGFGYEIDLGIFRRDECVRLAQHLRGIADELEDSYV
jgi:hypothetical protein